jgi:hypothetical protein
MKKIGIIMSIALVILNLTACRVKTDGSNGENETSKSRNISTDPNRIEQDIENNIAVDAAVNFPQSESANVWRLKLHSFDVELARELLFKGESQLDESVSGNGYSLFKDETFSLSNSTKGEKFLGFGYERSVDSVESFLQSAELGNDDLDFMTRDEAVNTVEEILQKLGISNTALTSVNSLDRNAIRDAVKAVNEQTNMPKAVNLKDYTEYSESYVLKFTQKMGDIDIYSGEQPIELKPFFFNPNNPDEDSGLYCASPALIDAVVSKEGITALRLANCFTMDSIILENPELITAEQAVEVIQNSYENIINTDSIEITDISLEYAILPSLENDGSFELYPTWVCKTKETSVYDKKGVPGELEQTVRESAIFVDAIVGKLLNERYAEE